MVGDGLRDENKSSGERAPFFLPPSLLIGVAEIDQEHQHLIEIINRAGSSVSRRQHLQEIVSALADHFANEEETMRQAGYPRLREHANHHKAVLTRMQEIAKRCAGDAAAAPQSDILYTLLDDILRADLPFKSYLQGKGLVAA
jgi:hemerythrin-like metal-binding protein